MATNSPQIHIRNVFNFFPDFRVINMLLPIITKISVVQGAQTTCQPGGCVDTIGNMSDRNFVFLEIRPIEIPHFSSHLTMQLGYTVAFCGKTHCQEWHAKSLTPGEGMVCQFDELVSSQPQLWPKV